MKKVKALARCIETMVDFSLVDVSGAINEAVESDKRVWRFLDDRTKKILSQGLGLEELKDEE